MTSTAADMMVRLKNKQVHKNPKTTIVKETHAGKTPESESDRILA